MQNANEPIPLEHIARCCIIECDDGYLFVTHEGGLVGVEPDYDVMVAKVMLYLSNYRQS